DRSVPGVNVAASVPLKERSLARRMTVLGFPLLLGALSASLASVIDTAMMGHYGAGDLAAVAGTSAVFDVFANLVLASLIGYQILAPRFVGREDPAGMRHALRASIWWGGGLALLLTIVSIVGGEWL